MKYKVLATENIFKNKFFDIEQVDSRNRLLRWKY